MNLNLLSSIPLCQTRCEAQGKLLDLFLLLSFALRTQSSVTAHCIAYISNSLGLHSLVPSVFADSLSFHIHFFSPYVLHTSQTTLVRCWSIRIPFRFNTSTNLCEMPHLILSLELPQIKGHLPYSSQAESVFGCT